LIAPQLLTRYPGRAAPDALPEASPMFQWHSTLARVSIDDKAGSRAACSKRIPNFQAYAFSIWRVRWRR